MFRTLAVLLPDLTGDELVERDKLYERHKEFIAESVKTRRELNRLRFNDPETFIRRSHASIERATEVIKTLNNDFLKFFENHPQAVADWKAKYPPTTVRKPKKKRK